VVHAWGVRESVGSKLTAPTRARDAATGAHGLGVLVMGLPALQLFRDFSKPLAHVPQECLLFARGCCRRQQRLVLPGLREILGRKIPLITSFKAIAECLFTAWACVPGVCVGLCVKSGSSFLVVVGIDLDAARSKTRPAILTAQWVER
jgi:hypothetical protein